MKNPGPDPDWLEWTKVKFEFKRGNPDPLTEYVRENPLEHPEQREFVADLLSRKYDRRHDRDIVDRYGLLALKLRADQNGLTHEQFQADLLEVLTSQAGPDDDPEQKLDSAMKTLSRHYDIENKCLRVNNGKKSKR